MSAQRQPEHPAQEGGHLDISHGFVAIIMGVSGTGKTTIGEMLGKRLDAQFEDADDFHSDEAKAKMKSGTALTDEDREPWLDRIQKSIHEWRNTGKRMLFACSGLKKKYRLVLTEELPARSILDPTLPSTQHTQSNSTTTPATAFTPYNPSPLYMFLLHAPRDVLMARISARKGHYFPPELLQSQLDTLEWPGEDEDVMVVDVSMTKEEIVEVLVTAIVKQHKGGEIGSHLHALVTESNVRDVLKEPVPLNPF